MIQTLRKPTLRTPPQHVGYVHSVEPSNRTTRCEVHSAQDSAALASSLRDVSAAAHQALKTGANPATISLLTARIEGIEHGFRELGLHDLARFAEALKRKVESGD